MEAEQIQTLSAKAQKAITTTQERSRTLFLDNYKIYPDADRVGVYLVQTPPKTYKGQSYCNIYEVDLANWTCDCEMFQFHGTCKHIIATETAVTKALELAAPFLAGRAGKSAPAASVQRENVPERAKTLSAGQEESANKYAGYAAKYIAPSIDNLRAQNRIETRVLAASVQRDGQRVDTVTGEVLEEEQEERPVRVLPVHGSSEWLRQVGKDFD